MTRLSVAAVCLVGALTSAPAIADQEKTGKTDTQLVKAERRTRVRLGGVTVGAGYARYSGAFYPYYGYGWYPWTSAYWSPFWDYYYPWYSPAFYHGYLNRPGPNMGEVRLHAPERAEVFLDGAYAGFAKDLKTIWLEPGAYNLEVRGEAGAYTRRIYVLSGKELKIEAELKPAPAEEKR